MNNSSHLVSIIEYAIELEDTLDSFDCNDQGLYHWSDELYEIAIWRRTNDKHAFRAELMLGGGGPTIWIEIDSRWSHATLHHSWGCDRMGKPLSEWTLRESVTEILKSLVEEMI
jgi:hypothetical protein